MPTNPPDPRLASGQTEANTIPDGNIVTISGSANRGEASPMPEASTDSPRDRGFEDEGPLPPAMLTPFDFGRGERRRLQTAMCDASEDGQRRTVFHASLTTEPADLIDLLVMRLGLGMASRAKVQTGFDPDHPVSRELIPPDLSARLRLMSEPDWVPRPDDHLSIWREWHRHD